MIATTTATYGLASFAIAACLAWASGFAVRGFLLSRGIMDRPGERSSHHEPTLRGGGIGIMAVVFAGGIWLDWTSGGVRWAGVMTAGLFLAIVSFWDDIRSVGVGWRFACHAIAACAALASLGWPLWVLAPSDDLSLVLPFGVSIVAGFLWVAGYTNAFNFMDGVNGLAGLQATITGLGTGLLGGLASGHWDAACIQFAWIVGGAAAGFLPHNFPRARMFMGDVGSAPLGFLLAVLALWTARDCGAWLLIPLLLLHLNFVSDTGITLVRRVGRGEVWFRPHREHFYQRLLRSGRSHTSVTLWEVTLQLVVLVLLVLYVYVGPLLRGVIIAAAFGLWSAFFLGCERAFRRADNLVVAAGAPQA